MTLSRRSLILRATATIAAIGIGAPYITSLNEPNWQGKELRLLNAEHQAIFYALIPAFSGRLDLTKEQIESCIEDIDGTIALIPQAQLDELLQLLDLLCLRYTRWFTTGFWSDLNHSDVLAIGSEFTEWRKSGLELYRQGASGLHELILGAFYSDPDNWHYAKYEGPPL